MTILVGYVNSAEGYAALARGIDEAKLRSEPVDVVHAARVGVRTDAPDDIAAYKGEMERIQQRLDREGIQGRAWLEIATSDPSRVVLNTAADVEASLIVIGIRRRSPVGKLVLGSWAQQILLGADCAVLGVKGGEG